MSAPAAASNCVSSARAIPIAAMLPDLAAWTPAGASSRATALGVDGQRQMFAGDGDQYRRVPELDRERQAIQLARETGIEVQHIAADVGARVTPLHDVKCPGHDTDVDAFLRRAALYVVGV